jgi:hypothetical protein
MDPRGCPRPSSLAVASDYLLPAQCQRVVMACFESPLLVENTLAEPNPESHAPEGLCITKKVAPWAETAECNLWRE